jgi:hypothetical protein
MLHPAECSPQWLNYPKVIFSWNGGHFSIVKANMASEYVPLEV